MINLSRPRRNTNNTLCLLSFQYKDLYISYRYILKDTLELKSKPV